MEISRIRAEWQRQHSAWRTAALVLGALVAIAAGVMYLRVTTLAPLGGDDCINNPSTYYRVMTEPYGALLLEGLKSVWNAFTLKTGRFFPFAVLSGLFSWPFRETVDAYRIYIICYTLAVAAVLGILFWQITRSRAAGLAVLATVPLMFCLWYENSVNGMYSYAALPQSTLLPALLAACCTVCWARTRHIRWAVVAGFFMLVACGTYEIGYTYIALLGLLALYLHDKIRESAKTLLPGFVGMLAALGFYIGNSMNASALGGGYVGVQPSFDPAAILRTWMQQMSAAFPLNPILLSGERLGTPSAGDIVWSVLLAVLAVGAAYAARCKLRGKQLVLVFLVGLSMLAGPALLIALSSKYQSQHWVNWGQGYISAVVESFGVGLMLQALLIALFGWLRQHSRYGAIAAAIVLMISLATCGAVQRATTQARYIGSRGELDNHADSLSSGLLDEVPEEANVVTGITVWGGSDDAVRAFIRRYTGRTMDAYCKTNWLAAPVADSEPVYLYQSNGAYRGCTMIWLGRAQDETLALMDGLKIYVNGNQIANDASLHYNIIDEAGQTVECSVNLQELPQSDRNERNGYFVWVEDTDILPEGIDIW